MGQYQIFEMDQNGKKILHHSLGMHNAQILAGAYATRTPSKTYGFEPQRDIDKNDVDFSNDIINDMRKERITEDTFLDVFISRKQGIKQALRKMVEEAKSEKTYSNLQEAMHDIENYDDVDKDRTNKESSKEMKAFTNGKTIQNMEIEDGELVLLFTDESKMVLDKKNGQWGYLYHMSDNSK